MGCAGLTLLLDNKEGLALLKLFIESVDFLDCLIRDLGVEIGEDCPVISCSIFRKHPYLF
jgi:hypothetical protein